MITGIYFLVLLAASVEDYRSHRVKRHWVLAVYFLGIINILLQKEHRWVTLALTCVCFGLLYLLYRGAGLLAKKTGRNLSFGGADVRLIPGMMLVQGWDVALTGVFAGLLVSALCYLPAKRRKKGIPLVPWMSAGCFFVEIIYLFSEKGML